MLSWSMHALSSQMSGVLPWACSNSDAHELSASNLAPGQCASSCHECEKKTSQSPS